MGQSTDHSAHVPPAPNGAYRTSGREMLPSRTVPDHRPLPECARAAVSEFYRDNAWARKTILTLDGGGVKGYSSLLILKRLMWFIAQIENGVKAVSKSAERGEEFLERNGKSVHYPWCDERLEQDPNGGASRNVSRESSSSPALPDEIDRAKIMANSETTDRIADFFPHHYFDYIAGTSSGGLSAIMLGRLRMSVDEALDQYDIVGNQVFGKPRALHGAIRSLNLVRPKYPSRNMKNALLEVLENGLKDEIRRWDTYPDEAPLESDQARCRTIAISYGEDDLRGTSKEYLFRSYDHLWPSPLSQMDHPHLNPGRAHREPIWKIARATSAAPTYFRPISFCSQAFSDGAIGANNPAERVLWEVLQMHKHEPSLLLSVGTGKHDSRVPDRKALDRLERLPPSQRHEQQRAPPQDKNLIKFWKKKNKLMIHLATESEQTQIRVKTETRSRDIDYYRLNVDKGIGCMQLDEWEPSSNGSKTKERIIKYTRQYMDNEHVQESLLRCARALVKIRRARARTERWERFATDVIYFCPEPSCNTKKTWFSKTYADRSELREHGINEHFFVLPVSIGNSESFHIACTREDCMYRVYLFREEDREELHNHFRECHGMDEPRFKTPSEIELWLDSGRRSQKEAPSRPAYERVENVGTYVGTKQEQVVHQEQPTVNGANGVNVRLRLPNGQTQGSMIRKLEDIELPQTRRTL